MSKILGAVAHRAATNQTKKKLSIMTDVILAVRKENNMDCNHKWVVYSTSIGHGCLLLVCANCGIYGTVADPTKEEWKDAFWAPDVPYEWVGGDERVVID